MKISRLWQIKNWRLHCQKGEKNSPMMKLEKLKHKPGKKRSPERHYKSKSEIREQYHRKEQKYKLFYQEQMESINE